MIFVTLGSQKFQFDRLLVKIDELIESKVITDDVFAQVGYSLYCPKNFEYVKFLDREAYLQKQSQCDLLITHGGTGAIIGAVKQGKRVIAVPRLARYGEHVDDHQVQLLAQFDGMKIISACFDLDDLSKFLNDSNACAPVRYVSSTDAIITSIDTFINNLQ